MQITQHIRCWIGGCTVSEVVLRSLFVAHKTSTSPVESNTEMRTLKNKSIRSRISYKIECRKKTLTICYFLVVSAWPGTRRSGLRSMKISNNKIKLGVFLKSLTTPFLRWNFGTNLATLETLFGMCAGMCGYAEMEDRPLVRESKSKK